MEKHLTGTWEGLEAWIRETIGADFHWRVRPQDNATNREMVASLILDGIKRNNGIFPEKTRLSSEGRGYAGTSPLKNRGQTALPPKQWRSIGP